MRVLTDPAIEGAANMGRDEALLEFVRTGRGPATLRFYGWSAPTISLGASQPLQDYVSPTGRVAGLAVVRRRTGGGAVLHDAELTYSLTIRRDDCPKRSFGEVYRLVQEAVGEVLRRLGLPARLRPPGQAAGPLAQREIFWCFDRAYDFDVLVAGHKIAGSAQRRTAEALLQHGSVILEKTFPQHPGTCLSAFRKPPVFADLAGLIAAAIEQRLDLKAQPGEWLPAELELARPLAAEHRSMAWLARR